MAFGQQAGPPATARQVEELRTLLAEAGHTDFRDARGPLGFNQRQANGRFTRDEAEAFITQLHAEADSSYDPKPAEPEPQRRNSTSAPTAQAQVQPKARKSAVNLQRIPAELLAAELQLRGWIVVEP
jgi:hypothetical protein